MIDDIAVARNTNLVTFSTEKDYVEYNGYKYNAEGIKGKNIFAELVGSTSSQSVTRFSITFNGKKAVFEITVVTSSQTVIANVEVRSDKNFTTETALEMLLGKNKPQVTKQTVALGIDVSKLPAETPIRTNEDNPDNGDDKPEKPPIDDEAPTTAEIRAFENLMDSKVTGTLLSWDIQNGVLYTFEKTSNILSVNYLTLKKGEGVETKTQLEALSDAVNTYGLRKKYEVLKETNTADYNGYTYSYNSLGDNLIYTKAGKNTRTSVVSIERITDTKSPTGFSVQAEVLVGENGTTKLYTVVAEVDENATREELILVARSAEGKLEILNSKQDILAETDFEFTAPKENSQEIPDNPGHEVTDTLDFSALENKLEEVILAKHRGVTLNEIISYSASNGKMYLIYDLKSSSTGLSGIYAQELSISVENLDSQTDIDTVVSSISKNNFGSSALITITKASSDITVNGTTYSKDGIDGDNIFAQQCGITNAVKTYVSSFGSILYSTFNTGYEKNFYILVISEDNENRIKVNKFSFGVECDANNTYSEEKLYSNLFEEGKYIAYNNDSENWIEMDLGQNLKAQETEVSNASYNKER